MRFVNDLHRCIAQHSRISVLPYLWYSSAALLEDRRGTGGGLNVPLLWLMAAAKDSYAAAGMLYIAEGLACDSAAASAALPAGISNRSSGLDTGSCAAAKCALSKPAWLTAAASAPSPCGELMLLRLTMGIWNADAGGTGIDPPPASVGRRVGEPTAAR